MVEMKVAYTGEKHCELVHGPSGTTIETDAPRDNAGRGESFSPTDLVGAALSSCVLTTMAIVAEREGFTFGKATAQIKKEMNPSPRRIARLPLEVAMPAGLKPEQRKRMEHVAMNCPVKLSLALDVETPMTFVYPD